jgi:hypothetical protein
MTIDREFFKTGRSYVGADFIEAIGLRKYTILETDPNFFWKETDPGQVSIWYDASKEEAVNKAMKLAGFKRPCLI